MKRVRGTPYYYNVRRRFLGGWRWEILDGAYRIVETSEGMIHAKSEALVLARARAHELGGG